MHGVRGPTSCVGRKVISPRLRGRGGGDLAGVGARGMRAGGGSREPGRPRRLHRTDRRGAGTGSPRPRPWTSHLASRRSEPQVLGWYRRAKATTRAGDGRRGVGVSQSTAEAGELSPRDPVEGRGHRQVAPLEGKTANTPRLGPVSTSRQRISRTGQARRRDGGGHRLASWTRGYATARSDAVCRGAGCGREQPDKAAIQLVQVQPCQLPKSDT